MRLALFGVPAPSGLSRSPCPHRRRSLRASFEMLAGLVATLAMAAGACAGAPPSDPDAVHFDPLPCWGPASDEVALRCGFLVVPESRERPNGREIQVAVTILSPRGAAPEELGPPLVHLAGGPGYGAGISGDALAGWLEWYADWAGSANRALILVDQRGTGQSEPLLQCDWRISEPALQAYFGSATPRIAVVRAQWWRRYMRACRERFDAAGIDVIAYNTAESAADLADLRRALGIERWDVWGVSYGTHLALELLHIDEPAIHGLILDSVSLYERPDVVLGSATQNFDRAFMQVMRDCMLDEGCREAFPVLLSGFATGMARMNLMPETIVIEGEHGWSGMTFVLDGRRVAELLFEIMYYADAVPDMPAVISGFSTGQHEYIKYLAQLMLARDALDSPAEVMIISDMCRNAPQGDALARLADIEGHYPSYDSLGWAQDLAVICADWGAIPADPAEIGPVHSDVPALILGGRYDPVTPPEWGRIVAGWLPNGTMIEFPHLAHGSVTIDSCADAIAARFLDDPGADPHDGCLDDLRRPDFLLPP